jgi:hypothetical protein
MEGRRDKIGHTWIDESIGLRSPLGAGSDLRRLKRELSSGGTREKKSGAVEPYNRRYSEGKTMNTDPTLEQCK